jgi:Leucine-rich repeat (LRR) protein
MPQFLQFYQSYIPYNYIVESEIFFMKRIFTVILIFVMGTIHLNAQHQNSEKQQLYHPEGFSEKHSDPKFVTSTKKQPSQQDSLIKAIIQKEYREMKNSRRGESSKVMESDSVLSADSMALVAFYNKMNGKNWTHQENWLSEKPVKDWWGITVFNHRVTEIDFYIHWDSTQNVQGELAEELFKLNGLRHLDLSKNKIKDTIPEKIAQLSNLDYLDLSENQLVGEIPPDLGKLDHLRDLYLRTNNLEGSIPPQLSNLDNLNTLYLTNNTLSGSIPSELGKINSLRDLYLSYNQLSGNIPKELGNIENLAWLDLTGNMLEGSIPSELAGLSNLNSLDLGDNQLKGKIPAWLGNLNSLERVSFGNNNFTDTIPAELGNLENLYMLGLSDNQLSGEIPPELNNLTNLRYMYLDHNQFDELPDLSSLTELFRCYIEGNQFDFGDLQKAGIDWSSINYYSYAPQANIPKPDTTSVGGQLTMTINTGGTGNDYIWIKDSKPLDTLSDKSITLQEASESIYYSKVINTQYPELALESKAIFTGEAKNGIHERDYKVLKTLYDSTGGKQWDKNKHWFTDTTVNAWYGITVEQYRVKRINLYGNNLKGTIPQELSELEELEMLSLGGNQLQDTIPRELSQLSELKTLYLHNNLLTGKIPQSLGSLTNLESLSLHANRLTGQIPPELGNLSNLVYMYLFRNNLSGPIPPEMGNLGSLEYLDLSLNRLEGMVPAKMNDLSQCRYIELSNNELDSLPDLQQVGSSTYNFYHLGVEKNHLTFGDLESTGYSGDDVSDFTYAPQNMLPLLIDTSNSTVTLTVLPESPNNQYQWFKNGEPLTGETDSVFSYEAGSAATYHCEITNNSYPDLTLQTQAVGANLSHGVLQKDYEALKALYNNTKGDDWYNHENWLTGKPVGDWYGVQIEGERVVKISLNKNNLSGELPTELYELDSLMHLSLYVNNLTGEISDDIANLSNLVYLDLDENQLTGNIPAALGSLENLYKLYIGWNQLEGSVPPELGNLTNLETFEMDYNQLEGALPEEMDQLTNLSWFNISRNQFDSLPKLSSLKKLNTWLVYKNRLTFADLDSTGLSPDNIDGYNYAPQKELKVAQNTLLMNEGDTLNLNAERITAQNTGAVNYKWIHEKDTVGQEEVYTNYSLSEADTGAYICYMTNERYPGLALKTDTIKVHINSKPEDIMLSDTTIRENQSQGEVVGIFSTDDPDEHEKYIYSFTTGEGSKDADNDKFNIIEDTLKASQSFNFEDQSTLNLLVITEDRLGATYQKAFTIKVTDVNEAPTDIALSDTTVAENQPSGTLVGEFSTTDPDKNDSCSYSLVEVDGNSDAGNSSFKIVNDTLKTVVEMDYEEKEKYNIHVMTTDTAGNSFTESFIIQVKDVEEETGIEPFSKAGLKLYPNPANGYIKLQGALVKDEKAELTISSLNGNVVYQNLFFDKKLSKRIDLQDFSPGIYIFSLEVDGKVYMEKIVVE